MILYTPLPVEDVLQGYEKEAPELIEMSMGDAMVLVQRTGINQGIVHRIISTEPKDYMRPELQPGCVINFQAVQKLN